MTEAQRKQCPETYRRLKLASLRAGESLPGKRVWIDARYPLAGVATVGMRQ